MRRSTITEFGKYIRKLRIDHEMLLGDLASNLKVSAAFLSAVENGKKSIPESWIDNLVKVFHLSKEEEMKLAKIVFDSNGRITIPETKNEENDMLILSFARKLGDLDKTQKEKIKKLLED